MLYNIAMVNIWQFIFYLAIFYVFFLFVKFYLKNRKTEEEFTSIVNHTFRTPLTRINWISRELENINLSREERLMHIQNLNNATNKLLEIVDLIVGIKDIKDANKYSSKKASFRNIVEKSIEKHKDDILKKNISFKISSFNSIPLLVLDTSKISFVIDTVIENAIIYTPPGGGILIDCIFNQKSNKLLFFVGDTGIGLSFYDKMKIFSRFYRSSKAKVSYPDGMGLRLYLSKQIVKKHQGRIYAKSKGKNKGAVFFVELPLRIDL